MLRSFYRFLRRRVFQRLVPRSHRAIFADGRRGIEVVGHFGMATGLGESARLCALQLKGAGLAVRCRDVSPAGVVPWVFEDTAREDDIGCRIFHLNPPMMVIPIIRLGIRRFLDAYNIGYWAWELEDVPDEWRLATHYVNAVMTPSEFTTAAISKNTDVPVVTVPHPVEPPRFVRGVREALGIDAGTFLVSNIFSFGSAIDRKNPRALVAAFVAAFGDSRDAVLVFKANGGRGEPLADEFRALVAGYHNVRLIDEVWEGERLHGLVAESDLYASLHRSEGFGLTLREAMSLGTPVMTTAWSGNMDFCTAENSFLVPFTLVPVVTRDDAYHGIGELKWAEADRDFAAATMAAIAANRETARARAAIAARPPGSPRSYADALDRLERLERGRSIAADTSVDGLG